MARRQYAMTTIFAAVALIACSEDVTVKVVSRTWAHTASLRERQVYQDSTCWSVPDRKGHYDEPTFDRYCRTHRHGEHCGVRDDKGHCTLYVPDYDERCEYSYYDWPVIDAKKIVGGDHPGPWPTYKPNLETFRESRSAEYWVKFSTGNRFFTYKTRDISRYSDFKIGEIWLLEVSKLTGEVTPARRATLEAEI